MTLQCFKDISYQNLKCILISALAATLMACSGGDGGIGGVGGTGSATLSWVAPSLRADESPMLLSEIDGYRIYYGTESSVYLGYIEVDDSTATSAQLSGIPAGKYFVAMTALDSDGLESEFSQEIKYDL